MAERKSPTSEIIIIKYCQTKIAAGSFQGQCCANKAVSCCSILLTSQNKLCPNFSICFVVAVVKVAEELLTLIIIRQIVQHFLGHLGCNGEICPFRCLQCYFLCAWIPSLHTWR